VRQDGGLQIGPCHETNNSQDMLTSVAS
jgi:hypothetical protein